MTTTETVTIHEIPLDPTDPTKTAWGDKLGDQYYFVIANGTDAAETFDAADITAATKTLMASHGRGISVNMGAGDDRVTASAYGDTINAGAGTNYVDGGENQGQPPGGGKARDVLNVFAADQAAVDQLSVTALTETSTGEDAAAYAAGYRIKVSNGSETDYLKNVEQVNVFVAGTEANSYSYVKTIRLALDVHEIGADLDATKFMHLAWAQGTAFADTFDAAVDVSAETQALMAQHGRGVWVDTGAGNDTITGSGYGDDIRAGAGTDYVDGGANAGSPPWGGKAIDTLHVMVADQATADAVEVTQLADGMGGADAQAFANGYTHKVVAGGETDYVKGIERVTVSIATAEGGSLYSHDIPLTVVAHEANLLDNTDFYHLAWVNGTSAADTIDASGDTPLLSAELKAAMATRGRGVWVDGGAGDDTITGSAYGDNFRNGSGNAKIDGGGNAGPNGQKAMDVFEITVASTDAMNAVRVEASDNPDYTWMLTYGAGSTQKDYLRNVEAIAVNVEGGNTGKWIALAVSVNEIPAGANAADFMHHAWAHGTEQGDSFNADADVSAATKTLMAQHGRGVWADMGAGNDTVTGSGFGDDIAAGSGTNYVDGGANAGSPPWGGKAQDVLHVRVANAALANAVTVTALAGGMDGADAQAFANGYTHKVVSGDTVDYIKGIERISVEVDSGDGAITWARDIPLAVVVHEANLADTNSPYYHLAWVDGTDGADTIDAGGDSALFSAEAKAAMAARGRGVWIDGGAGNDTITGTAYGDNFRNGAGDTKIDGGGNTGPNGQKAQDVFEITVASTEAMNAIQVVASDDPDYTWMVTYGEGSAQKDYLKNVEAIAVNVEGGGPGKWIALAMSVNEIQAGDDAGDFMHHAWAHGTTQDDSFDADADVSGATKTLMAQHGRGVWADMGAGDDTVTGSGFGDDIAAGSGTNYVDGGANAGSPPWGGKAQDVLHVRVANAEQAEAVTVTALAQGMEGADAQAYANGYTHKVVAAGEIDYIKGIERISVQVDSGNGSSTWVRDIRLAVTVFEADLANTNNQYYHLAWVEGTAGADTIDASGDSSLFSAEVKAAMAARGRGVWIDGGAGDDTIIGTAQADNFRNGAGNAKIDGGDSRGPDGQKAMDVFEISVASTDEMKAIQVVASDDPNYTWMVTYGDGSAQKDYLKNVEAVAIHVTGGTAGRWLPLAMSVHEVPSTGDVSNLMYLVHVQGAAAADGFDAAVDVSSVTRALMTQHGRGVFADMGAGNDTVIGSGYGDTIVAGPGTNYVDGGANAGTPPGGGQAADVLDVYVADQAAADAVKVVALTATMTGADLDAFNAGYQFKVTNGTAEVDYVRNIERVNVLIWNDKNGDGWRDHANSGDPANEVTFVRSITPSTTPPVVPNTAPSFAGVPPGVAVSDAGHDFGAIGGTVLKNGKMLATSWWLADQDAEYMLVLNRTNADGSVDTSFGAGTGRVLVPTSYNSVLAPVELADGKLLVAVTTFGEEGDLRVLRLNADGSLDTAFGTGGATTVSVGEGPDSVRKMLVDAAGKIVLVGAGYTATDREMAVVRLNANGSLDTGFNGSGKLTMSLGAGASAANAVALQADGKLVLAGYAPADGESTQAAVVRLNADGTLDATFGDGGKVLLPLFAGPNVASAVQVQADGRIVLGGYSMADLDGAGGDPALARLNANGSLDSSFGTGGIVRTHPSDQNDNIRSLQLQADGKIVTLGLHHDAFGPSGLMAVSRFNANGSPDTSFGHNGVVTIKVHGIGEQAASLALSGDKIIVFGSSVNDMDFNTSNVIVRLNSDGTPDASFGAGNPSSLDATVQADGVHPVVLDHNVSVYDAEMAARGHYGGASLVLERAAGASPDDVFIGVDSVSFADGKLMVGTTQIGTAVQAGGRLTLVFNEQATQGLLNQALHGIAYVNPSANPAASVTIGWTFSDNDTQAQGGALAATGTSIVQIGLIKEEVAVSRADPTLSTWHEPLSDIGFMAEVYGTARAETFNAATGLSPEVQALMAQYKRGMHANMGAGDDNVAGTAYSDEFVLGGGTNRLDGGANEGSAPHGGPGFDTLHVFAASALLDKVTLTTLSANSTGADREAFDAGYTLKVDTGSEVDYVRNIESIVLWSWNDANGNQRRDSGEVAFARDLLRPLRVYEVEADATDPDVDVNGKPLSETWHFASAYGGSQDDTFNAATDVSATTQQLMSQWGRGVYANGDAGNDTLVGSAFGDRFIGGTGINWIDGGANAGVRPGGGLARDELTVMTYSEADAKGISVTQLTPGMGGTDGQAFANGYAWKVVSGGETDYLKNIEEVNVFVVNDANGNGRQDAGEHAEYHHRLALAAIVDEVRVSATDPARDDAGNLLTSLHHFAWAEGGPGGDSFSVAANVSSATQALMTEYGRGVWVDSGAGNDVLSGSSWRDDFISGAGTNRIDGGANNGIDAYGDPAEDYVHLYVADQAAADAVTVTMLTSGMAGEDGAAYAAGYRVKVTNGEVSTDYLKDVEGVTVSIWNDKDGDGERDHAGSSDPANEVTFARGMDLAMNQAPSFGPQQGVGMFSFGYDFTPYGLAKLPNGQMMALSMKDQVDEGYNYTSVLTRHRADGSLDTSFGGGSGKVELPVYFGHLAGLVAQPDGKVLMLMSSNLTDTADFKVVRLDGAGNLDPTFGVDGAAVVSLSDGYDSPAAMLLQADGKIVVVGSAGDDVGMLRLNPNGTLDTTFNASGKLVVPVGPAADRAMSVVQQGDKLLLSGWTTDSGVHDFALVRVNADGTLDSGFGSGGKVTFPVGASDDLGTVVRVLGDGKILVAGITASGEGDTDIALARLNADGSLDTSFGTAGKLVLDTGPLRDFTRFLEVQADGKIVIAGFTDGPTSNGGDLAVLRLHADGSPDTGFGHHGKVALGLFGVDNRPAGLALVDSKIVVLGVASFNLNGDANMALLRLNADGSIDTSFAPASPGSLGGTVRADGIHPVVLDFDAAVFDPELAESGNYGGAQLTLQRQGGANPEDVFTAVGEVSFANTHLTVDGQVIGWVEQGAGTLTLHFQDGASQGMVNRALHGIAYSNGSANPPSSVTIDWIFQDGNNGSQGLGGDLGVTASTTVQIGLVVKEVVRSYADPAVAADGRQLDVIDYLGTASGSVRGESFDAASGFSGQLNALMSELQRGAMFDMGAGNDTVTGTAYGDRFVGGAGVNRIDGGANAGTDSQGGAALDVLEVFVADAAAASSVSIIALSAMGSAEDLAALEAGYEFKVSNGTETNYVKGVEAVMISIWTDRDGDGVRDYSSDDAVNEVVFHSLETVGDSVGVVGVPVLGG